MPTIPSIPYAIFGILSLLGGLATAVLSTDSFIADSAYPLATRTTAAGAHGPNARVLALQLGNLYGLMALLGFLVVHRAPDVRVVRAYLAVLAAGDVAHLAATTYVLGVANVLDVGNYNVMMAGNILATVFLFAARSTFLFGGFGAVPAKPKKA